MISENGLLDSTHAAALAQVTADDAEIHALAPWLNAPSTPGVSASSTGGIPVRTMLKTYAGHSYLFVMADGNGAHPLSGNTTITVNLPQSFGSSAAVYGEGRSVSVNGNSLSDSFSPYQVHVYQLS
jgi:hypothetical protein